jgi:hypothetical protein
MVIMLSRTVIPGQEAKTTYLDDGREACASARPVETIEAVRALPVRHSDVRGEKREQ